VCSSDLHNHIASQFGPLGVHDGLNACDAAEALARRVVLRRAGAVILVDRQDPAVQDNLKHGAGPSFPHPTSESKRTTITTD